MKSKVWNDFLKPVVILVLICIVTSALLGATNMLTAPVIVENAIRTANEARRELLPAADKFTEMKVSYDGVVDMYAADNGEGHIITAAAKGYGGEVPVMVAFDKEGQITAVKFLENTETAGLGQKVHDKKFYSQFAGRSNEKMSLSDIDAITGATITSSAALTAINSAITAYNEEVMGKAIVVLTPEETRAAILPDAGDITKATLTATIDGVTEVYKGSNYGLIIYTEVKGFYKKPLFAAVGFDNSAVVTGVWFDASKETEGFGQQVGTSAEFAAQFIGKTSADGIDAIAGATVSSTAAQGAVQLAIDAYSQVKEAV